MDYKDIIPMNKAERVKMVKAMEFIARQTNNEDLFYGIWAAIGVADGDIEYGDLSENEGDLESYLDDGNFSDLMGTFLTLMNAIYEEDSGLFCDGVTSM